MPDIRCQFIIAKNVTRNKHLLACHNFVLNIWDTNNLELKHKQWDESTTGAVSVIYTQPEARKASNYGIYHRAIACSQSSLNTLKGTSVRHPAPIYPVMDRYIDTSNEPINFVTQECSACRFSLFYDHIDFIQSPKLHIYVSDLICSFIKPTAS